MNTKGVSRLLSYMSNFLLYCGALVFIFPFYISIAYSLRPSDVTRQDSMLLFPIHPDFGNYIKAIKVTNYFNVLKNNVLYTVITVLLIVVITSMAAYVIARNNRKIYNALLMVFIASIMVPFQVIMLPIYRILKGAALINTPAGYIIIQVGLAIAFNVFIYTGFIKTVPRELEESGVIDGCGPLRIFWQVVFPLLMPITATVVVLSALSVWNDFTISLIVLQSKEIRPLSLTLYYFMGRYAADMNLSFATFVLIMLPIVSFYFFGQKYIVSGMTAGALKG